MFSFRCSTDQGVGPHTVPDRDDVGEVQLFNHFTGISDHFTPMLRFLFLAPAMPSLVDTDGMKVA